MLANQKIFDKNLKCGYKYKMLYKNGTQLGLVKKVFYQDGKYYICGKPNSFQLCLTESDYKKLLSGSLIVFNNHKYALKQT